MPRFKNQENQAFVLLPPGDYTFEVVEMEAGIQSGTGKTAGSPFWEVKLKIDKGGTVFERLIDHPTCDWKIDTFLKSTNSAPPNGEAFEFVETAARDAGCLWINPIGLRGWCHLIVDEYTPKGATTPQKKNKVGAFLTDRAKIARAPQPEPASAAEEPATASTTTAPDAEGDGLPF